MNTETFEDILREMRTYFQRQKRNGNPEHRTWHQVLSDWADRLEAALAREREMSKGLSKKLDGNRAITGDAAAMREALERIRSEMLKDSGMGLMTSFHDVIDELTQEALSAPARNCDRYGDEDDAFAAWHDALNDGDVVSARNAFAWLFAKAEGEEAFNG